MTWGGDSTKNQMKSYSTLTQQIKSFSHDEEADSKISLNILRWTWFSISSKK